MQDVYTDFILQADLLKEATNGRINMYKTGSEGKTALKLFYELNKTINPEKISKEEQEWIRSINGKALIFAIPYSGPGYKYDINSEYPTILYQQRFRVPIKQGDFKRYSQEEFDKLEFFQVGLYRCDIEVNSKFFVHNSKNMYTHYDLTLAKEEGGIIKLIQDENTNALIWGSGKTVSGSVLFKKYIDLLYPLKKQKIEGAKLLLNVLPGKLCQKNLLTLNIKDDSKDVEIYDDRTIDSICPINDNTVQYKYYKNDSYFDNDFARLGPFLWSRARLMMARILRSFKDNIKRVHTDGFISDIPLKFKKDSQAIDSIKIGKELGDLKYEGFCDNCEIKNNVEVIGDFLI